MVAPSSRVSPALPETLDQLSLRLFQDRRPDIHFHPQCFESWGHFAGSDEIRARAFLDVANDDGFDALWFGRGGYGSFRLIESVLPGLKPTARAKTYLGYSDMGSLLGALYRQGFAHLAHGPMVSDVRREGGEVAARGAHTPLSPSPRLPAAPPSSRSTCPGSSRSPAGRRAARGP